MNKPDSLPATVTRLLHDWSNGNQKALDQLMPLVYDQLRRSARRQMHRESPGHTFQPTDLVHELYLELVDQRKVGLTSRAHFFALAAQLMRRILVEQARNRRAVKRGGGAASITLDESIGFSEPQDINIISLDHILNQMAVLDPQQARIVELRFFGGLTIDETAEVLKISSRTVDRDWRMARAWIHSQLNAKTSDRQ